MFAFPPFRMFGLLSAGSAPLPDARLPVVYLPFRGNPGWDADTEVAGQGMDIRLVEPAQFRQFPVGGLPFVKLYAAGGQNGPQFDQLFRRQAIMSSVPAAGS